jgi:hypothetical protein
MLRSGLKMMAATALVVGTSALAAPPASAASWPSNCSNYKWSDQLSSATCTSGGGYFKASALCRSLVTFELVYVVSTGPWMRPGNTSYVKCPYMSMVSSMGVLSKSG